MRKRESNGQGVPAKWVETFDMIQIPKIWFILDQKRFFFQILMCLQYNKIFYPKSGMRENTHALEAVKQIN